MKPSKERARKPARQEFGTAPKTLERPRHGARLQRPADVGDVTSTATAHGEDAAAEREKALPREDRAG